MAGVTIEFRDVTKIYSAPVVDQLNLTIPASEIVALVGPSGCGKTTSLKMINRLIEPTSGSVLIDGKDVTKTNPTKLRRGIGYVIQGGGMIPHFTVAKNIGLVPKLVGWDKKRVEQRVDELLELVGLDPSVYRDRYPRELSGGQQQRVGVARGLAADPPVVLMDEPFGAVDPVTRTRLQDELLEIQHQVSKTIVIVTHDIDEAVKLGDRIAVLQSGAQVAQYDTPENILSNPANDFVAQFVGSGTTLKQLELYRVDALTIDHPQSVEIGAPVPKSIRGDSVVIVDKRGRPHDRISAEELAKHSRVPDPQIRLEAVVDRADTVGDALGAMLLSQHGGVIVTDRGRYMGVLSYESVNELVRDA